METFTIHKTMCPSGGPEVSACSTCADARVETLEVEYGNGAETPRIHPQTAPQWDEAHVPGPGAEAYGPKRRLRSGQSGRPGRFRPELLAESSGPVTRPDSSKKALRSQGLFGFFRECVGLSGRQGCRAGQRWPAPCPARRRPRCRPPERPHRPPSPAGRSAE